MDLQTYLSENKLKRSQFASQAGVAACIITKHLKHNQPLRPDTAAKVEAATKGAVRVLDLIFKKDNGNS